MTDDDRTGTLSFQDRRWHWWARSLPDEGGPGDEGEGRSPFLDWWTITFRLDADPEQRATVRAGIPEAGWGEETLRSVLRAARERTWRDDAGRLWHLTLEGWSTGGISTTVARGQEPGATVVFRAEGEGAPEEATEEDQEGPGGSRGGPADERTRRPAGDVSSLTEASDPELQAVLEGGE